MRNIFAKNNAPRVSFDRTLRLVGIPIVPLQNNGIEYNFILDSGATTSLVNSSILDELTNKVQIDGEDLVSGLDPSIGYKASRYDIEFNIINDKFRHQFSVINLDDTFNDLAQETGIKVHGLLGSDFFRDKKYILDYNEHLLYHK